MNHQSLKYLILEHLAESGKLMVSAFFPPHYTKARLALGLLGLASPSYKSPTKTEKHRVSNLLSYLQTQGLVARSGSKKKSLWEITDHGKKYLDKFSTRTQKLPPKDGLTRIVTFDVPEVERKKRDWLRSQLVICDFRPLHRSVWMGERPLPQDLIESIRNLGMLPYIHIIGVSRRGTLTEL